MAAKKKAAARAGAAKAEQRQKTKDEIFFRELAMVCNVTAALKAAGMVRQSRGIYERRSRDPEFRAQWDEAVGESYAMLELEMLARGRHGEDRPPPKTEAERRLRELTDKQAMNLLRMHKSQVKGRAASCAAADARREAARRAREKAGRDQPPARRHRVKAMRLSKFALLGDAERALCLSIAERVALLPVKERRRLLGGLSEEKLVEFVARWMIWARPGQLPPDGDWRTWLLLAGRGFGKTRAGAEWVSSWPRRRGFGSPSSGRPRTRCARVMVEGESGLLACARDDMRP